MEKNKSGYSTIDEYIALCPAELHATLKKIRSVIKETAPDAEEKISYQMPAFFQNGILLYFGAFKDHISLFPASSGVAKFKEELSGYKGGKGTIQFPLDKPIPYDLIKRIVKFRLEENFRKLKTKSKK